jgi:hypothetical protein
MYHEETESWILINRARNLGDVLRPLSDYQILEKNYTDYIILLYYIIVIIKLIIFQALQRLNSGHASLETDWS